MKDIELPPLPDLLKKAVTHFAQACLYSEVAVRRSSAEQLQNEIRAYARAAVEADRAQRVPDADAIAQFIRQSDGAHQMGAAALGERLHAWIASTPAQPAQQEPSIPAEFDVRTILLSISPGEDGMGHEVYAASVADVEGLLTSMGQELEEWQLGIRRLPTAQHQEPPQPVERKPMTGEEVIEGLSEIGVTVWGPRSEDFERGVRFAERHHGIRE